MPDTQDLPQVAPIGGTASASGGVVAPADINALVGDLNAKANAPLPDMYSQGTSVTGAHVPTVRPYQPQDDNRTPITGKANDIKHARHENAIAGMSNAIGKFAQDAELKKQDRLKDKIQTVLKAKQNIANAQVVLNDPNASQQQKQMATAVLNANKTSMEGILSEDKDRKALQKAFDVSFVDPEKNKTPEVQTMQKAVKEFKSAGPFNADNPQEHAVAQIASGASSSANSAGSVPSMQPAKPNLPAPAQTPVTKAAATPYADAALKKDLPTIEANPQYAAALKQRETAQAQLAKVLPVLVTKEMDAQVQAAKDGNANARATFTQANDNFRKALDDITKIQGIDMQDKNRLQVEAKRAWATVASASIRANAAIKVAEMGNMTKENIAQLKQQSVQPIDKLIDEATNRMKSYGQRQAQIDLMKDEGQKDQAQKMLNYSMQQDQSLLKEYQDQKAKILGIPTPTETESKPEKGFLETIGDDVMSLFSSNKDDKNAGAKSEQPSSKPAQSDNLLGSDKSDESDNSEDDSDKY